MSYCQKLLAVIQQIADSLTKMGLTGTGAKLRNKTSIKPLLSVSCDATARLVEHRVSDRKVADSWFDSRAGNASLRRWKRHLTLFPIEAIILPVVVAFFG